MISLRGKTILVVDDEPELTEIIGSYLELCGASVLTASDGVSAFKLLSGHVVDLIISDVRMPGEGADGFTFLKKVRAAFPKPPPFFFITGFADSLEEGEIAREANLVISKPFTMKELESAIAKILVL